MPSKATKILEFYQYQKPDNAPFIIYADLESLIEKIDGCKTGKSSTAYSIRFLNVYNTVI